MVKQIGDMAEFDQALVDAGNKLVVVDFTAQWCGPCRRIGPIFHTMSEEPEFSDVVFLKVDVDEVGDVSEKYGVTCMPTFMFFKNGTQLGKCEGANEEMLRKELRSHK